MQISHTFGSNSLSYDTAQKEVGSIPVGTETYLVEILLIQAPIYA